MSRGLEGHRDVVSFIHSFISCSFMMSDLSNRVVEFSGAKNKQDMRKPVESWFWSGSSLRKEPNVVFHSCSFMVIDLTGWDFSD